MRTSDVSFAMRLTRILISYFFLPERIEQLEADLLATHKITDHAAYTNTLQNKINALTAEVILLY